ncbi:conserved Plasmodium protein, unknown function [Plasmodium ovale curtisi]|uniref:Uncharacterized protein n=1 Tax=Plasmodium ovale curtisi TaxID=864141 RepID=A0A1A8WG97_PLAOA|nr:conserved Plasmodium protein, unknown function [Plasmodium ovale curtisi]
MMMLDGKYENLNRYNLKLSGCDERGKKAKKEKKKNDLRNILFFPSLFWHNGNFSPPIPLLKYDNHLCKFKVKDYVCCSVHKHSVIIRRILKNEILHVNMFNDEKVLTCVFCLDACFVLKLGNVYTNRFKDQGSEGEVLYQTMGDNDDRKDAVWIMLNPRERIPSILFCLNEKNEIHLFDVEKNSSILRVTEENKVTCMNFNFLYINKKNSLYNNLSNDIYVENIKVVDIDNMDDKILGKNKMCFELLQEKLSNCDISGKMHKYEYNGLLNVWKNFFYILIYGDNKGGISFFVPQKRVKIKKKLMKDIEINFIETNVKEYFKIKNKYDLVKVMKNNFYVYIAYKDCTIYVVNMYLFEVYFTIHLGKEKIHFLSTKWTYNLENYLCLCTKSYVKIFNVDEKREIHHIMISDSGDLIVNMANDDKMHATSVTQNTTLHSDTLVDGCYSVNEKIIVSAEEYGSNEKEEKKKLLHYTCAYFDSGDYLYISNGKGIFYKYNLKKKSIIERITIDCKLIFYLFQFTLNSKDYVYVYDSEKFYCLYDMETNNMVYKLFTISTWIYQILCFKNNILFSLGNENIYNIKKNKYKDIFLKPIYGNSLNICIYLINHPFLPIIGFVNKNYQFGFFYLNDTKKYIINIPNVKENKNIISICWFVKKNNKSFFYENNYYNYTDLGDNISSNDENYFSHVHNDSLVLSVQNNEFMKKVIKKKKRQDGSSKGEECSSKWEECSSKWEQCSSKWEECSSKWEECSSKWEDGSSKGEDGSSNHFKKVKIVLFDSYRVDDYVYIAVFSKKKKILVHKMKVPSTGGVEEPTGGVKVPTGGVKVPTGGVSLMEDAPSEISSPPPLAFVPISPHVQLIAQFVNFYTFDHVNKLGSILCMKFFYNTNKEKIYLIFGGLEQFLFYWNFLKYPLVKK